MEEEPKLHVIHFTTCAIRYIKSLDWTRSELERVDNDGSRPVRPEVRIAYDLIEAADLTSDDTLTSAQAKFDRMLLRTSAMWDKAVLNALSWFADPLHIADREESGYNDKLPSSASGLGLR